MVRSGGVVRDQAARGVVMLESVKWNELFGLDVSPLELVIRTSVVYLALLLVLRVISRRSVGSFELPELLMIVLVADGVQNGMVGDYASITGAVIIAGTLVTWNYVIDWLTFRSTIFRRVVRPAPLKLIEDGRLLYRNMRREFITEEELRNHLRVQGIEDVGQVKLACMEPEGELSVVKRNGAQPQERPTRPKRRVF